MKLSDIFSGHAIQLHMTATDKVAALGELTTLLARAYPELDREKTLQVLIERERLGSTAIGEGVAIPHGKLEGLSHVIGAMARSEQGIDFASYDQQKTNLFFILLAPEGQRGVSDHLKALAKISRLLRDSHFRSELSRLERAEDVYQLLVRADE